MPLPLEQVANLGMQCHPIAPGFVAEQAGSAAVEAHQAHQSAQHGCLARAIRAEEAKD